VIADFRRNFRGHAKRLVDATEVVVHEVKRDRAFKDLHFL